MSEKRTTARAFHDAVGVEDWRVLFSGAHAYFHVGSFAEAARFVAAIAEVAEVVGHFPDVDVRPELREDAYGQRILDRILAVAFVAALAAYVAGYLLKPTATTEPFGLLADLLYTFGFALWTAAVVVVLVEIIPEVKRRQIRSPFDSYEAIRRDKARQKDTT
jgi:hypothetical protein